MGPLTPVQMTQALELLLAHLAAVLVEVPLVPHAASASAAASWLQPCGASERSEWLVLGCPLYQQLCALLAALHVWDVHHSGPASGMSANQHRLTQGC